MRAASPIPRRFWECVGAGRLDECWLWCKEINTQTGYGVFCYTEGGKRYRQSAHRAAYRYTFGAIPEGMQVNHHCDVRACVNPRHLYAGTQSDNMCDRRDRGRTGRPRLFTDEQVRMIRSSPESGAALARSLGCNQATISLVRTGRTYADVA